MLCLTSLKKTIFSGIFISAMVWAFGGIGCTESADVSGPADAPSAGNDVVIHSYDRPVPSFESQLEVNLMVEGVQAKISGLSMKKLAITLTSASGDTVSDTLSSTSTPALICESTTPQNYSMLFKVAPLRAWKVMAKTLGVDDSVVEQDSTLTSTINAGAIQIISLNLSQPTTL